MATGGSESPVRLAAETWESLFRAQVAVMRKLQSGPAFRKLAVNEYDVLFTLSRCPSGWLRLNELNDNVLLSQSSLSRLVERLEKRGLVARMPAPEDGRGVLLKLTDEGRELQKEIGREHVRDISALVGPALTAAEQKELMRLTDKLRSSLGKRKPSCTSRAGSSAGRAPSTTAVTRSWFRTRLPPTVDRKAVSDESRPAVMRSIDSRGASPVGSMTCQAPAT